MWQRSPGAPHRLTPAPLPVTQAHILLSSACPTVIHLPHARLVRSGPTASLAPWPARSSPPSALLPLQHRRSCTSALTLRRQRLTPLPPLRGREGLAYPVRVFFNTTPGCRDRHPDERCRPVWTNRPPPSGEDRCVYPAGRYYDGPQTHLRIPPEGGHNSSRFRAHLKIPATSPEGGRPIRRRGDANQSLTRGGRPIRRRGIPINPSPEGGVQFVGRMESFGIGRGSRWDMCTDDQT